MFGFNFTDIIFHFLDDSVYFRVQLFPMFVQGCCRFLGVCNQISYQHMDARCYVLVFGLNSFCSNSCKSICMPSFFICSAFTKSANARPMCSLEVTECKQTGLLHCSQQSSHFYLNVLDIWDIQDQSPEMKLALLCVLWRYQRDVPPHRLYTDVFDINHGAQREQESHSDDTLTHPGPNSGPCSNTLMDF